MHKKRKPQMSPEKRTNRFLSECSEAHTSALVIYGYKDVEGEAHIKRASNVNADIEGALISYMTGTTATNTLVAAQALHRAPTGCPICPDDLRDKTWDELDEPRRVLHVAAAAAVIEALRATHRLEARAAAAPPVQA